MGNGRSGFLKVQTALKVQLEQIQLLQGRRVQKAPKVQPEFLVAH
jgi:hypothetical protein